MRTAMVERLAERKVFVDWRPGAGLRMSPHFFNTDEEVEEALQHSGGADESNEQQRCCQ